jgi:predicted GIY-YIG superfamily endonuclease
MAKKQHFVCEHLENISREALEEYQGIIRKYVRRRQGVYALYRRGKLYYVGLATNLRNRLKNHLKDRHGESWDRFGVYLTIGDSHLRELEALTLRIVRPKGNKQKGKLTGSEDMRRRLTRDLKEFHNRSILDIMGRYSKPIKDDPEDGLDKTLLAGFITAPMKLRAHHGGKLVRAQLRRDGWIRFGGQLYKSPSAASSACCKKPTNGWKFWEYERAHGDWVALDELRR